MLIKNKLSAEVNFSFEAFFFGRGENVHPYCIKTESMHRKNTAWIVSMVLPHFSESFGNPIKMGFFNEY